MRLRALRLGDVRPRRAVPPEIPRLLRPRGVLRRRHRRRPAPRMPPCGRACVRACVAGAVSVRGCGRVNDCLWVLVVGGHLVGLSASVSQGVFRLFARRAHGGLLSHLGGAGRRPKASHCCVPDPLKWTILTLVPNPRGPHDDPGRPGLSTARSWGLGSLFPSPPPPPQIGAEGL